MDYPKPDRSNLKPNFSKMYILGKQVKGGFYGQPPNLIDLDDGNLKMTTDFRSVYATMLQEWMGFDDIQRVLKGDFAPLGVFASS